VDKLDNSNNIRHMHELQLDLAINQTTHANLLGARGIGTKWLFEFTFSHIHGISNARDVLKLVTFPLQSNNNLDNLDQTTPIRKSNKFYTNTLTPRYITKNICIDNICIYPYVML
jgi:hypothetical protein